MPPMRLGAHTGDAGGGVVTRQRSPSVTPAKAGVPEVPYSPRLNPARAGLDSGFRRNDGKLSTRSDKISATTVTIQFR